MVDVRTFDLPRWLLSTTLPLSFGLTAIEFVRFLLGHNSMHSGQTWIHE